MTNLKFSVVMCLYCKDNAKWFRQALESVITQTHMPDEIVLVEDGPVTPELDQVVQEYLSKKVPLKVVALKKNVGFGNACQVGVENSTFSLVARMDSDDICVPERFEKQLAAFEADPALDMLGGGIGVFSDSIDSITHYSMKPSQHESIMELLKKRSPFAHVTMMLRKEKVLQAGGYIEWFCEEDYYLWARMLLNGCKGGNIQEPLVYVRTTKEQMARRGGKKYFYNEVKMQKFLLKNKVINLFRFIYNVVIRFVAEIILPPNLRYSLRQHYVWKRK
jgi:glycosyltransferase involved in cell wall biosynthesis